MPFIIVTSFAVLNLFIGIIVDGMNIAKESDIETEAEELKDAVQRDAAELAREISALRSEISEIKSMMRR